MPKHFTLTTSSAALVVELTRDPQSFHALLEALYARRWDGQLLIDFRRGRPRQVGFPQVARVRLTESPPSKT